MQERATSGPILRQCGRVAAAGSGAMCREITLPLNGYLSHAMSVPTIERPLAESVTAPAYTSKGLWATVAESLRGTQQDFTQGSVRRAIVLLAVPMVLEIALESVFAVTDVFFVGRLGAGAVATVGITESMLAVLYAVAAGLGVGATAMVARRIGEHDRDGAAHTAAQAVSLGLLAA